MYLAALGLSCGAWQLPASFLHVGTRSPTGIKPRPLPWVHGLSPWTIREVPGLTGGCEWAPRVLRLLSWLPQEQACEESQRKTETETARNSRRPSVAVTLPRHTGGILPLQLRSVLRSTLLVQPTLKGRGLHKSSTAGGTRHWETIQKAAYPRRR